MKNLVTGLMLITLILAMGCGERHPCAEEGCEQPHEIGSYFCRSCRHERWIERELAKAEGRKKIMIELGWKADDLELKRVRALADAIQRPTRQVISSRTRWDKEEWRKRNKVFRRNGLLP